MTNKNYNPNAFKMVLDTAIFATFLAYIIITFAANLRNTIAEGIDVVSWD